MTYISVIWTTSELFKAHTHTVNEQEGVIIITAWTCDNVKILTSSPHPIWLGARSSLGNFATLQNTAKRSKRSVTGLNAPWEFTTDCATQGIRTFYTPQNARYYKLVSLIIKLHTRTLCIIVTGAQTYAALPWILKHEFPSYYCYTY